MMKDIVNNLQNFLDFKVIDKENIFVISPFCLRDTDTMYPINIKKIDDKYIIHDGGSLIIFLNENDLIIDKINIQNLLREYPNFQITDNNELVYSTTKDTICFDIAKYIQIITKITD